ncbi:ubiquitin-protein ligase anaphase promoting complex [Scheffersomyces amazonensis]|uniref:ubiquitin-protein ligase anaphase promoting complex n=1 Tax=Scheffersomyces amazonensis TaxID=1078765 RepID=UPI00315D7EB4
MKVKIVEWHGFSTWHWNLVSDNNGSSSEYIDELCGICRVAFDGTCPNCRYPGDECPIVLGAGCSHNFHLHCIIKWLEQNTSKGLCPMCRQVFTYKETNAVGSEEMVNLQNLIMGHKSLRDSGRDAGQMIESMSEDGDLQMTT